ncbi:MAG: hypothetical protein H6832_15850 [Planctomycetes bacterium]|nr:hypothetical protein [Planctomycetota bacterium]MCB9919876.1 hypothetical protein [Planctomycetota bacterium]
MPMEWGTLDDRVVLATLWTLVLPTLMAIGTACMGKLRVTRGATLMVLGVPATIALSVFTIIVLQDVSIRIHTGHPQDASSIVEGWRLVIVRDDPRFDLALRIDVTTLALLASVSVLPLIATLARRDIKTAGRAAAGRASSNDLQPSVIDNRDALCLGIAVSLGGLVATVSNGLWIGVVLTWLTILFASAARARRAARVLIAAGIGVALLQVGLVARAGRNSGFDLDAVASEIVAPLWEPVVILSGAIVIVGSWAASVAPCVRCSSAFAVGAIVPLRVLVMASVSVAIFMRIARLADYGSRAIFLGWSIADLAIVHAVAFGTFFASVAVILMNRRRRAMSGSGDAGTSPEVPS